MRSVIVIGGGISGLAAAWELRGAADVTVLEGAPKTGGKLRTGTIAGVAVDEGAESLMALRPEAVELARAVGLGGSLCDPAQAPVTLWTRGALRPLPAGHVMGIPTDPAALAATGILSPEGTARAAAEPHLPAPPLTGDVSVAAHLSARFGREAVDRLVEPLLGGIYAGRADALSLRAVMPRIAALAERGGALAPALRRGGGAQGAGGGAGRTAGAPGAGGGPERGVGVQGSGRVPGRAVAVQGVVGGAGRLPEAVARASRARVLTGTAARALERTAGGRWRVLATTADGPLTMEADAVVLAVPAYAAAELLRPHSPAAEEGLAGIPHASTAVITMAFARDRAPALPAGNGFLVPPVDGRVLKAASFLSNKWGWLRDAAPDLFVLRASVGRIGDDVLDRPDRQLVRTAVGELHRAVGPLGEPVAARVSRWDRGLPQYGIGHRERVADIRAAVTKLPGLFLCGAAYDGVGVAACVATGRQAAALALSPAM
ncbi:protoporphyrinogen oxidase [Streptomyces bambusae]|uniref:protoporphyrinogen oxidase n=1 Tax=Streptomyces bambusae TaxID=1550616 RepID=UPI001CFFE279|nr:protoporphyrinogen oxidase [Streptomyces bambusae]MCB5169343.1 protoporphyrinogen oxidase [Streptomyces bambusae]